MKRKRGPSRRQFLGGSIVGVGGLALGAGRTAAAPNAGDAVPLDRRIPLDELDTPALVLDVDAFERNLATMAEHARKHDIGLRPHAKTHKCPIIAKRQMELGALGICCAKVSEAEVMRDAGIEQILITSPVATEEKIERVIELARRTPGLVMLVDHPSAIEAFDRAARAAGMRLRVVLGLDTGTRRTGIALGEPALRLAQQIDQAKSLDLQGIQAYAGHVMHIEGHEVRARRSRETLARCLETRHLIEKAGIEVGIFSGGGTGTFDIDCDIDGMTDLQVGSYCFMDVQYRAIGDRDGDVFDVFEPALFVLATAISQPVPELITVDAGYKAFANEPNAKPVFRDREGLLYHYGGDEHGIVQFTSETPTLALGEKAELLVSHCDPTVNLYDVIHPVENGFVEELWPISARGHSQ